MEKIVAMIFFIAFLSTGCAAVQGRNNTPNPATNPSWNDPSPNTGNNTNYQNMMQEQDLRMEEIDTIHTTIRR